MRLSRGCGPCGGICESLLTHAATAAASTEEREVERQRRRRRRKQKAAAQAAAQATQATDGTGAGEGDMQASVAAPAGDTPSDPRPQPTTAEGNSVAVVPGELVPAAEGVGRVASTETPGAAARTPVATVRVAIPSSSPQSGAENAVDSDDDHSTVDGWSDETSSDDARAPGRSVASARRERDRSGVRDEGQYTLYSSGDEDDDVVVSAGTVGLLSPSRVAAALNLWRRRCHRLARRVTALENALVGASAIRREGPGFPGVGWVFTPPLAACVPNAERGVDTASDVVVGSPPSGSAGAVATQQQFQMLAAALPRRRPVELLDLTADARPQTTPLVGQLQRYVQKVYRQQRELWYGQKTAAPGGDAPACGGGGSPQRVVRRGARVNGDGVDVEALADEAAEDAFEFGGALKTEQAHQVTDDDAPRWEDPWWLVSNLRRAAAAWQRGTHAQDHGCWVWFARNLVLRKAVQMANEVG